MIHQRRQFASPLEFRDAAGKNDGRTVFGRIVPYGEVIEFLDEDNIVKRERFELGSLAGAVPSWDRVTLSFEHHPDGPGFANTIGWGMRNGLTEAEDGAYASFRLYAHDAAKAREALQESHRGLSLEFYARRSEVDADGVIVRRDVRVVRVAAVPDPAYMGASVMAVRSEAAPAELGTPNLDAARAILAELRRLT